MKRLSVAANWAWRVAAWEANEANHQHIGIEHLVEGIFSLQKVIQLGAEEMKATKADWAALCAENDKLESFFVRHEIDPIAARRRIRDALPKGDYEHKEMKIHRNASCKRVFDRATQLAESSSETTCFHLLAAILEVDPEIIQQIVQKTKVDKRRLLASALEAVGEGVPGMRDRTESSDPDLKRHEGDTALLNQFGRDLVQAAKQGKLSPFAGRRKELLQIIQTLARRSKNNPVLVGEPGVGKTAVVEALAQRIAQGKDPHVLGGKTIIELQTAALLGGTKYRGDFEERLHGIINETRAHPEIIVFIDEIHTLVGAGGGSVGLDAANIVKPALANGDMRCIGATTISEYRRHIEKDPALERRFDMIMINEPNSEETLEILKILRPRWEEHHHTRITDAALEAAINLSIRFDTDHQLPDKAVDLVDRAGALVRVPKLSMNLDGPSAADSFVDSTTGGTGFGLVTDTVIAEILSAKLNIPLEIIAGHLERMGQSRLTQLETALKASVLGQDDAIERVCRCILTAHAGLRRRRGPLAVFLFVGPTGVGKTELAKQLSAFLFGDESHIIQLDMSEYREQHSVSKLIGSPPGYIGHEEEGQLTGKLRTKPYSVVLLDEIEKAHPAVFDFFLQLFDEGRLTDSKGRTASAKNAIFVMTSNIAAEKHIKLGQKDERMDDAAVLNEIKKVFRKEFLNRIDEQIVFAPLEVHHVSAILKKMLDEIAVNMQSRYNVTLVIDGDAEDLLARSGYSYEYGVRHLRRTVQHFLEAPLSELVLDGRLTQHAAWEAVRDGDEISVVPLGKAKP